MIVGYRVVDRFDPSHGEGWDEYLEFAGLPHLAEVVGLDALLCPALLREPIDEDWNHLVFGELLRACFDDPGYALARAEPDFEESKHQLLAVAREEAGPPPLDGFLFMGYELIDECTSISALTNCGGFEGAFVAIDLNESGLLPAADRAYEVQRKLLERFPEEPHADCAVWLVWRSR